MTYWICYMDKDKKNRQQRAWRKANPAKVRAYAAHDRYCHPDRIRRSRVKWEATHPIELAIHRKKTRLKNHGLVLSDWDNLFALQGFKCGACSAVDPGATDWCLDHDHKTGKVRGILCRSCNLALGHAKDDPAVLLLLIQYLEKYS